MALWKQFSPWLGEWADSNWWRLSYRCMNLFYFLDLYFTFSSYGMHSVHSSRFCHSDSPIPLTGLKEIAWNSPMVSIAKCASLRCQPNYTITIIFFPSAILFHWLFTCHILHMSIVFCWFIQCLNLFFLSDLTRFPNKDILFGLGCWKTKILGLHVFWAVLSIYFREAKTREQAQVY